MSNYNADRVRVAGSGSLWRSPLGTPLPADSTTSLNAGFVNFGYATDGFSYVPNLKTTPKTVWQTMAPVRIINTDFTENINFEAVETNKTVIQTAFPGATVNNTAVTLGTGTIVASTGVITVSGAHGLIVGDRIQLGAITGTTGISAATTYYVITVPSSTKITLSATFGGTALSLTTDGSTTAVYKLGPYSLTIPDKNLAQEFSFVAEWNDGGGVISQRIVVPRATLASLPTIKNMRTDLTRYPFDVQVLQPMDGSQSIQIYGVDAGVVA